MIKRLLRYFPSEIEGYSIWNRLGERDPSGAKARPLIVQLKSDEQQTWLLDNLRCLKGKEEFKDVRILPDRTKLQRENDKLVLGKMKEDRDRKNAALSDAEKNEWEWVVLGRAGHFRLRKMKKRV